MTVGLVWDERYLAHQAPQHVESPERLKAIRKAIEAAGLWDRLVHIQPAAVDEACLLRVHSRKHIAAVRASAHSKDLVWLDGDTYACCKSYETALLAAGGLCAAADAVMKGEVRSAFCAVRPPGHHATRDRAMGFCLFNNVAVAVRHVQAVHGIRRVLIVDWDVHHGNGTQHMFESDPRVFYLSLHEDPYSCYPGTGFRQEEGKGPGKGFTLNLPLPAGSGDIEYLRALEEEGLPRLRKFAPQFILISAGFDAHESDPLAHQNLTREAYRKMGGMLLQLAEETAEGRLISLLEGGYNLTVLADCVEDHLRLLLGHG